MQSASPCTLKSSSLLYHCKVQNPELTGAVGLFLQKVESDLESGVYFCSDLSPHSSFKGQAFFLLGKKDTTT